jgi:tripartite-type tricarboxylate transporter receptor subunit TctC
MRKSVLAAAWCLASALALTACGGSATAKQGKETGNFTGKTIDFVIPFDAGGGYDSYARMLAPKLGEKLGATVVVINKPGAGGLKATNEVWNSRPDGKTIVMFNTPGHLGSALAGADGVQYKPEGFGYIGQISSEPDVLITQSGSKYASFDNVLAATTSAPVRFAATGPGSNEYVDPVVIQKIFGVSGEVVTGFASSNEAYLAVLAGNVDAHSRSLGSQLPGIAAGDAKPLLVIGAQPAKDLAGVPTILDVVAPEKRELAESHVKLIESGRTIAAPPGTDPKLLAELRKAFEEIVKDAEFVKAAEAAGRPISGLNGDEVTSMIERIMKSPTEYVDTLKVAYGKK